jgi:RNA polymerase sigma-70 factor (ECF subfamily)
VELKRHDLDTPSILATIRLAQQGDAAAFELIYRLHCRRVYALCLRIVKDTNEAEDWTQEAFMQLFRKIHTFREESAFASWLHRLTVNIVLMGFRKKKLMLTSLDEVVASDGENDGTRQEIGQPDLRLVGLFDRANLRTAIDQLPKGCKTVLILYDVKGYEHKEIAKILGCSVANSKAQLHRARRRLRKFLQDMQGSSASQNYETAGRSQALATSH